MMLSVALVRRRGAALGVAALSALLLAGAAGADATPPVFVSWSVSTTVGCNCIDFNVALSSPEIATLTLRWGTSPSLGSQTNSVPLFTGVAATPVTVAWTPAPPPGDYYVQLIATNSAGTTSTQVMGLHLEANGNVNLFLPPQSRPALPSIPEDGSSATIVPSGPVTVVAGDSISFRVTVGAGPYWPDSWPLSVFVVLPGNVYAGYEPPDPAFDLGPVSTSAGSCVGELMCDFGTVGHGAEPYTVFALTAKQIGSYQMVVSPAGGSQLTVPVTVVQRSADLQLHPTRQTWNVRVGGLRRDRVAVTDAGPNPVGDAVATVGSPRALHVTAAVGGTPCTPVPIRCPLPVLAPGQTVYLAITSTAIRSGSAGIPIGVSSPTALDDSRSNNTAKIVISAAPRRR